MNKNVQSITNEVQRALNAKIEAHRRHLASGIEVRKADYEYRQAKEALFNLEHDILQDQENER